MMRCGGDLAACVLIKNPPLSPAGGEEEERQIARRRERMSEREGGETARRGLSQTVVEKIP